MNGSRSTPPQPPERSSLDALNRTIEGLEARIEGLMGSSRKDAPPRLTPERPVDDTVSQILQRQQALQSSRPVDHTPARMSEGSLADKIRARLPQPSVQQTAASSYAQTPSPIRAAMPAAPDSSMQDIAQALVSLRGELKRDISEGIAREMAELRTEIRGIKSVAGQHGMADDVRDDLARLADSINQLGQQATPADAASLRQEFDELRAMMDHVAREDSLRLMDDRFSGVEQRLSGFDAGALQEEVVSLAYRIDDLKAQMGAFGAAPAFKGIEDKVIAIATAMEMLGKRMVPDDRHIAEQFAGLDLRLDEITRAIAAASRQPVSQVEPAMLQKLENRIAALAEQIDVMAQPPVDDGLSGRIEALTARVEDLASSEAANRLQERLDQLSQMLTTAQKPAAQPELTGFLSDISRKIDALDQGSVNDALAHRLDYLARRIDEMSMPVAPNLLHEDGFHRLELRLSDIAARLDESTAAPATDMSAMRNLESQISNLTALLNAPRQDVAVMPEAVEQRLTAMEEFMATSDEYIIEAARQAAEAVMEAYSRSGALQNQSAPADMSAIAAFADDLRVLENLARSSEDRNQQTFEALHDTLIQIAERLDQMGSAPQMEAAPAWAEPVVAQPVYSQPVMPQPVQTAFEQPRAAMPKADVPAYFDDLHHPQPARAKVLESATADQWEPSALDLGFDADDSKEQASDTGALVEPAVSVAEAAVQETAGKPKISLLAGLGKRFLPSRKAQAAEQPRQVIDPVPALDASDMMDPAEENFMLEPGSGAPDVKKILEKVRASQAGDRSASNRPAVDSDKADFIGAARRAARAAADEVDVKPAAAVAAKKDKAKPVMEAKAGGSALGKYQRPVLLAIGAILLVVMSYPMVNTLLSGPSAPADQAVIEQPAAEQPADSNATADPAKPADADQSQAEVPAEADQTASAADPATELTDPAATDGQMAATDAVATEAATSDAAATDLAAAPAEAADGEVAKADVLSNDTVTGNADPAPAALQAQSQAVQADGNAQTLVSAEVKPADAAADGAIQVPDAIQPASLVAAAQKGDPLALFEIAARYTEGKGVATDLGEALKWYQKSADAGFAPALYRLANLYEKGTGVERDLTKAKGFYEKAADQGNASAMHNLAVLLATGAAGTPDMAAAAQWFKKAADYGVKDSQFNLAILYARGNGLSQDLEESYKWFAIAAKDGDKDAAQKRDEIANSMPKDQVEKARAKVALWKVQPMDEKANGLDIPDEWVGKAKTTASIDMDKAIRNIQAILNNNGFKAGVPDGKMGAKTVAAIKAFQTSIGQEPTGEITDELVKELLARNK